MGRRVIPTQDMVEKIKVAVETRSDPNFMIIARTDARTTLGLDEALRRMEQYAKAGADLLFIESPESVEEMRTIGQAFDLPLVANMVEGGKTPVQSADVLGQRGYKIVIFPGGTARAVAHTLQGYYASLHQHQTTLPWQHQMLDFDGLNAVIGTPELLAQGKRYE